MSKLISFAGVSRVAGELKFRGAQSVSRITQLQKLGDTEVEMRYLNTEMTKQQAAQKLIDMNFANGRAEILELLVGVANEEVKVTKPKTVKVKSTKARLVLGTTSTSVDDAPYTPKQAAKIRAEFMKKLKVVYEAS